MRKKVRNEVNARRFLVNYTEKGRQIMILDIGAPVTLARKEWMS